MFAKGDEDAISSGYKAPEKENQSQCSKCAVVCLILFIHSLVKEGVYRLA